MVFRTVIAPEAVEKLATAAAVETEVLAAEAVAVTALEAETTEIATEAEAAAVAAAAAKVASRSFEGMAASTIESLAAKADSAKDLISRVGNLFATRDISVARKTLNVKPALEHRAGCVSRNGIPNLVLM